MDKWKYLHKLEKNENKLNQMEMNYAFNRNFRIRNRIL
jgi:hypothetical protein